MPEHKQSQFYKLYAEIAERRDLTGTDKVVFAVIADRIGNNRVCWPGLRSISNDAGVDKSTVIKAIERLQSNGLLKVEKRGKGGTNHYQIVLEGCTENPTTSVRKIRPLDNQECTENTTTGGSKTRTEVYVKSDHNQTDQLNQTKSPDVKVFIDWFCQWYETEFKTKYIVKGGQDGATTKTLLKSIPLDQLQEATVRMGQDPFWRPKSSISTLSSKINEFLKRETNARNKQSGQTNRRFQAADEQAGKFDNYGTVVDIDTHTIERA